MQATKDQSTLIRRFLDLSSESLPSAVWASREIEEELGSPWPYLHDALRKESDKRLNSFEFVAVLYADHPVWSRGVRVTI